MRNEARAGLHEAPENPGTNALDRAVLFGLVAVFLPALAALVRVWETVESQSHGFLAPAVAGWIAWSTRDRCRRQPRSIDAGGAALLALALALYATGLLAGSASVQGLALVTATAGAGWWREGRNRLRAMAFPIAFLLFMVPIPADWFTPLAVHLLLMVSWASAAVLDALGVEVIREGNVLTLASGTPCWWPKLAAG